ncbi:MAG: hypothetical protein LBF91_10375, partial [Azoarcus sp.]|nr:hypothetical protein [Azoarcus sp.]
MANVAYRQETPVPADGRRESDRALLGVVLGAALFCLALAALRFGVIENGLLPRDCGPEGRDAAWSC